MTTVGISVSDLSLSYPGSESARVLESLSLDVKPGEIVALLGSSGCGKSTLLRAIAGLLEASDGGVDFVGEHANRRKGDISFVFQDATLLPWRTVSQNILLPFEVGALRKGGGDQRHASGTWEARLQEVLAAVGLNELDRKKYPRELSGGMRMRTSIARALITDPSVLLLDEPFAALDEILRTKLNELVLELWEQRKRTILFVTHNIAEAITLSQRVVILGGGKVHCDLPNPLPWPRTSELRTSAGFAEFYGRVSQELSRVA
ncbi:MAG: ABC transporter ATP-binding protein [Pirellulaceae bacterium]